MTKFFQNTIRPFLVVWGLATAFSVAAQTDSTVRPVLLDSLNVKAPEAPKKITIDSSRFKHSPKKAAIRSAILPGWGQIYNKRYWKLPLVYGGLGISGGVFFYNLTFYKDMRDAYRVRIAYQQPGATPADTAAFNALSARYRVLDVQAIRTYRDEFRRNIDYSFLFFLIMWGLNVVDATVDAHLRSFDVSPDLSVRFKFGRSAMAGTTGLSLVLALK